MNDNLLNIKRGVDRRNVAYLNGGPGSGPRKGGGISDQEKERQEKEDADSAVNSDGSVNRQHKTYKYIKSAVDKNLAGKTDREVKISHLETQNQAKAEPNERHPKILLAAVEDHMKERAIKPFTESEKDRFYNE